MAGFLLLSTALTGSVAGLLSLLAGLVLLALAVGTRRARRRARRRSGHDRRSRSGSPPRSPSARTRSGSANAPAFAVCCGPPRRRCWSIIPYTESAPVSSSRTTRCRTTLTCVGRTRSTCKRARNTAGSGSSSWRRSASSCGCDCGRFADDRKVALGRRGDDDRRCPCHGGSRVARARDPGDRRAVLRAGHRRRAFGAGSGPPRPRPLEPLARRNAGTPLRVTYRDRPCAC